MIKDPVDVAPILDLKNGSDLQNVLTPIATRLGKDPSTFMPLLCSLSNTPQSVIGASVDHVCELCNRAVWTSPSSRARLQTDGKDITILCLACVEDEWGAQNGNAHKD